MAITTAPTMKNSLAPCFYPVLRNGHIIHGLPVSLEECKLFEGRDCDLVTLTSLEPNTLLGTGAQAIICWIKD